MASALSMLVHDHMVVENLTAAEVARRGGLPTTTVAAIRDGSRGARTRPETAKKLAKGLGLPEELVLEAAGHSIQSPHVEQSEERIMLAAWRALTSEDREVLVAMAQTLRQVRGRQQLTA